MIHSHIAGWYGNSKIKRKRQALVGSRDNFAGLIFPGKMARIWAGSNLAYEGPYGRLTRKIYLIPLALTGDARLPVTMTEIKFRLVGHGRKPSIRINILLFARLGRLQRIYWARASRNPVTERPMGWTFLSSVSENPHAQIGLVDHMGRDRAFGCWLVRMGGMQVLEWVCFLTRKE